MCDYLLGFEQHKLDKLRGTARPQLDVCAVQYLFLGCCFFSGGGWFCRLIHMIHYNELATHAFFKLLQHHLFRASVSWPHPQPSVVFRSVLELLTWTVQKHWFSYHDHHPAPFLSFTSLNAPLKYAKLSWFSWIHCSLKNWRASRPRSSSSASTFDPFTFLIVKTSYWFWSAMPLLIQSHHCLLKLTWDL